MPSVGDECWRDSRGDAHMSLPFRVQLPDGTTRTDPEQWSLDAAVMAATGWSRSTLTQQDIDRLFPPPPLPDPIDAGWQTPMGWRMAWRPDDVALFTGLYVLAKRASEMGISQPIVVQDTAGEKHSMTLQEFEPLMLAYGAARAALTAGGDA